MEYTEEKLEAYAASLSESENDQCKHAIMMVRDALQGIGYQERGSIEKGDDGASYSLRMGASERDVTIFVQGSYANSTK